jgi:drug/metabolite transporter (DMT)-like permease
MTSVSEYHMAVTDYEVMSSNLRHAVAALAAAGLLWGTTVPLSKLALVWLPPGWLTVVRFGLAAAILLAVARHRGGLRAAFTLRYWRPARLATAVRSWCRTPASPGPVSPTRPC